MKPLLTLMLLFTPALLHAEEETRTWEGTWNNRKYNTSGPLRCVATHDGKGTWTATFSGTFHRDPFEYKVDFKSEEKGRQLNLSGDANIRGHEYQWQGMLKGSTLTGEYKSNVGYFGQFNLKEKH